MILPAVYPITDTRISGKSHIEQVRELADAGARFIQLRDKYASSAEFFESASAVMKFARANDVSVIINDRVDIAVAVDADGVHLGQTDLPPTDARKILGPEKIIGYSTHSLSQAIAARSIDINYLAIGPVFPTTTKQDPDAVTGIRMIGKLKDQRIPLPIVAIGGINAGNARDVLSAGADSIAVISALLNPSKTIADSMSEFSDAIDVKQS